MNSGAYGNAIADSTLETNETIRLTFIVTSSLGSKLMTEIRPDDIQDFINGLRKTSRKRKRGEPPVFTNERVSPAYENRIFAFVSKLFTLYGQYSAFLADHMKLIADPTKQGIKLRGVVERRHEIPEPEHIVRILNPTTWQDRAMMMALGSGLRASELCRAQWPDIVDNIIYPRGTKSTKSPRPVPLPDELLESMKTWPRRGLFIFVDEDGQPFNRSTFSHRIKDRQIEIGMPENMRPLQDLRVAFAVYIIEQSHQLGEDNMKLAQELLRHAKMSTTSHFYARARMKKRVEATKHFFERIREDAQAEAIPIVEKPQSELA